MITFGAIYASVPRLWQRERMYSNRLIEWHFWLALSGAVIYVVALWNGGILQGLMWRTTNEAGSLTYSFTQSMEAMQPYYVTRAIGGLLFVAGAIIGSFNVWMTIRSAPSAQRVGDTPELRAGDTPEMAVQ